jgi:hypothetical protein
MHVHMHMHMHMHMISHTSCMHMHMHMHMLCDSASKMRRCESGASGTSGEPTPPAPGRCTLLRRAASSPAASESTPASMSGVSRPTPHGPVSSCTSRSTRASMRARASACAGAYPWATTPLPWAVLVRTPLAVAVAVAASPPRACRGGRSAKRSAPRSVAGSAARSEARTHACVVLNGRIAAGAGLGTRPGPGMKSRFCSWGRLRASVGLGWGWG